jgi:ribonuclease VapC
MVIDTSAIIAVLSVEAERNLFLEMMEADTGLMMSAVTLHESSIVIASRKGSAHAATLVDEFIDAMPVRVVPLDREAAVAARAAYFRFGRGYHPAQLNMGDCFSYSLAKARNLPLLFKGDDFAKTDIVPAWRP